MTDKHKGLEGIAGYDDLHHILTNAGLESHLEDLHLMGNHFLGQLAEVKNREDLLIKSANEKMVDYTQKCEQVVSLLSSEIITLKQQDRRWRDIERQNRVQKKEVDRLTKRLENAEWLYSHHVEKSKKREEEEEEKAVAQEMTNPSEKASPKRTFSSLSSSEGSTESTESSDSTTD